MIRNHRPTSTQVNFWELKQAVKNGELRRIQNAMNALQQKGYNEQFLVNLVTAYQKRK